jgi:hypothetical protein
MIILMRAKCINHFHRDSVRLEIRRRNESPLLCFLIFVFMPVFYSLRGNAPGYPQDHSTFLYAWSLPSFSICARPTRFPWRLSLVAHLYDLYSPTYQLCSPCSFHPISRRPLRHFGGWVWTRDRRFGGR